MSPSEGEGQATEAAVTEAGLRGAEQREVAETEADESAEDSIEDAAGLATLLEYLRSTRGFDFTGYKRGSLARRIRRRMQLVGCTRYTDYVDFLQVHPDELAQLLDTVLINVTSFFRDAPAWDAVREHVARIVASRPPGSPIRVWSAGCASGEEAYSLAMVVAECMGTAEFARRVKVYATDVDDGALAQARAATYGAKAVESVPPELLARYFTPSGSGYVFSKELRRAVIFGRHDLLSDAPISRIDVLACRNTLIYFNAETQAKLLARLQFALSPDGVLFLGKAEMLLTHGALFTPLDLKLRIFTKTQRPGRERYPSLELARKGVDDWASSPVARIIQAAFDAMPHAIVVLDPQGHVARVNQRASLVFGLGTHDVGRLFQDLELSYRPTELRSLIDRVRVERRALRVDGIERTAGAGSDSTFMDLEVVPLVEGDAFVGTELCFQDSTPMRRTQAELRKANLELTAAHEELQSTSEELETTNEELQSTVEELETTNEELQSTNEELETMNEELQSTNAELQALNEELSDRSEALNQANDYLSAILGSLRSGIAVLDGDLVVRTWNDAMTELWGLRAEEVVGKPFLALEIGLPIDRLAGPLRASLAGAEPGPDQVVTCVNRRGRQVEVRAAVRPLRNDSDRGVLVLVEEV